MVEIEDKKLEGYTFIDLFAGIGGFRLGLESLGAKCVFSSEIDEEAASVYEKNFGERPYGDITQIKEEDVPDHDILCAGFPCQAFSASGKKLGFADSRGTLFFDVARIVKHKRPKVVFMENVMYMVMHDEGRTLAVVQGTMKELGYNFYYQVLNAADYGVPQQRKRLYMVAFREDLPVDSFLFPLPVPLTKRVKDIMVDDEEQVKSQYVNREYYLPTRKPKVNYNEVILVGFINKAGQGERIYNPEGVSITLSTGNKAIFTTTPDLQRPRRLIPRECARLMGFPDSYELAKVPTTAHHQLGNSVVVDVIQYIAMQIARFINDEPEELVLTPMF